MTWYNCHDGGLGNPGTSLVLSWAGGAFTETKWKAPYVDLDLDWRNKTAPEICARVKENLPTHELRHKHFHEDARLSWAIQEPKIFGEYLEPRAKARARVRSNRHTPALRHKHFHKPARLYWAIQEPKIFGEYLEPRAYP